MLEQNTSTIPYEDPNPQPSELLQLLSNLKNLVQVYVNTGRKATRKPLLEAVMSETHLLCAKLSAMHTRWKTYLPYSENIDVRFGEWAQEIGRWSVLLTPETRQLPMGFVLDLQHEPLHELGDNLEEEVPVYLSTIDKRLSQSSEGWETKAFPEAAELCDAVDGLCQTALQDLAALKHELEELESFFSSELQQKHFRVLAHRLRARDCKKAEREALVEVHKAHNTWPEKFVKERASSMKADVKLDTLRNPKFAEVGDYLDLDFPEPYADACFGQYLFKNRHVLSKEEVQLLTKNIEKIRLLNEYIDPKGTLRKRAKVAQGRQLTPDQKAVVARLCEVIGHGNWRNGTTADSITLGMKKALGVEFALPADELKLSDKLWLLFTKRNKCGDATHPDSDDAREKSFKVTWLNIVGWCVTKDLLSGTSPSLCSAFFGYHDQDDYKAIDKAKNKPPKVFTEVCPLLDKYLKM